MEINFVIFLVTLFASTQFLYKVEADLIPLPTNNQGQPMQLSVIELNNSIQAVDDSIELVPNAPPKLQNVTLDLNITLQDTKSDQKVIGTKGSILKQDTRQQARDMDMVPASDSKAAITLKNESVTTKLPMKPPVVTVVTTIRPIVTTPSAAEALRLSPKQGAIITLASILSYILFSGNKRIIL